ncbi:MAG: ATP-binding protein [Microcoleus sp. PH2017_40_RAT_O_B]|uniref:P-loop NTPase fold protein n=1 Tax=unclassified Microcoleus TaxID=2642155 RepID=UPI001D8827EF|nr:MULTISPECIES: P-loop NTPase fold protein [unclassified Microcoleus]MCC3574735.1 ATP-binding protein [Microcoleus sp. PH2017_34_RAT_O_A]MCC3612406.1 ATP-binding protein [Microcoleus sp. PH2017_40_RAT_O_B]
MNNIPVSPIEALNAAIQNHNPFSKAGIVKEQDIWGKGFPDLPTLNAHASDAIFQAVEKVKTSQSSQEKVTSLVLTASMGVGKSHILNRTRHRLESNGNALFVYASVNNYTDLNLIKYQFQQTLVNSLSRISNEGVMQCQEIAAAMVNECFKAMNAATPNLSTQKLLDQFDQVCASWATKNKNYMKALTKQFLRRRSNVDPYIVRAVLWTLSETETPFAIKWLSGEELDKSKAEELGLPTNSGKTNQDREVESLNNVQKILNLVSYYRPIIICFDEIDVNTSCRDDGLTTPQVIADLVKRLYDTLEQSELSQGLVIITVMMPYTWTDTVNVMSGGIPDRLSTYTQRKPIDLKYLNGDSLVDLVQLWLQDFYQIRNLNPHHPVYPFEESQLREYGRGKPTVREALTWCAENFQVFIPPVPELPEDPVERFELALTKELEADIREYMEDNSTIAKAIYFGFETLKGQTIDKVTVDEITAEIKPKAKNAEWIKFKIIGTENGRAIKIGVAILQSSQSELVAGLKRLIDYQTFDLTRGCLVRSQSKIETIKKNSKAYKLLEELVSFEKGGEVVYLIEDQIKPLLAVRAVCKKCRDYNLTEDQVWDFISQKQLTFENLLLREILSDPSGEMPAVDDEDENLLLEDIFNPPSSDDTDDGDLSDLFS